MKTLFCRYLRSIKENSSFYFSCGILTLVTLLLFYLFYIGGYGILTFSEEFFARNNLEDAHFTTYIEIDDIQSLEDEFNVVLEKQLSFDITTNGVRTRLFTANEKINLYEITGGNDLQQNRDIIISEGYAENMNIKIGQSVQIGEKTYNVVGYFQRPDYLYMLEEESDSYKNVTTFFLAYVSESEFESFGTPNITYLVKYNTNNQESFRKAIYSRFITRSYVAENNNPRITLVYEQAEMFITMSYIVLVAMSFISVILICIVVSRKIKEEKKIVGTLSAFGMKKWKIAVHYAILAIIPALFGGVLAFVFSSVFAVPYGSMCLTDYEPMHIAFKLPLYIGILGVVIPLIMYAISAIISVLFLLKNDTVKLLTNRIDEKGTARKILKNTKKGYKVQWTCRLFWGSPVRIGTIILGIVIGCTIILMSLGIVDSVENISATSIQSYGTFEYEYVFSSLVEDVPQDSSPILISTFTEETSGKNITFIGLENDNAYINIVVNGTKIENYNGYYLSSAASLALNIFKGDSVTFFNSLNIEYEKVVIDGVCDYDLGCVVFTSNSNMSQLLGLNDGVYNGVMSENELEFEDGLVAQTIKKSALIEQLDEILSELDAIIWLLALIGIIICVAVIYMVINMSVGEMRQNIALLKVLGFSDVEIKRQVIDIFALLVPIGLIIAVPCTFACLNVMWLLYLEYDIMLISTYISPLSYIIAFGFTFLCYLFSTLLSYRTIKSVDLVEALKYSRE